MGADFGPPSPQLFPIVEETMLRPLWESREHYEELKQLDDAMKEVKAGRQTGDWQAGRQAGKQYTG